MIQKYNNEPAKPSNKSFLAVIKAFRILCFLLLLLTISDSFLDYPDKVSNLIYNKLIFMLPGAFFLLVCFRKGETSLRLLLGVCGVFLLWAGFLPQNDLVMFAFCVALVAPIAYGYYLAKKN